MSQVPIIDAMYACYAYFLKGKDEAGRKNLDAILEQQPKTAQQSRKEYFDKMLGRKPSDKKQAGNGRTL